MSDNRPHWSEDDRVTRAFAAIKEAETTLKEVREACRHPSYSLAWWSWRVGNYHPSRVCDVCKINLPGITDAEIDELGPMFGGRTGYVLNVDSAATIENHAPLSSGKQPGGGAAPASRLPAGEGTEGK